MKINEVYTDKASFLKAEDLKGENLTLQISHCSVESLKDVNKIVISFDNYDKQFVCNVTNAKLIAFVLDSDDTDNWLGQSITLRPDKVNFQGDLVDCIRIDTAKRVTAKTGGK